MDRRLHPGQGRDAADVSVSNDMTIAREEIFGPVAAVMPFDTAEDALRIANDTLVRRGT
nr:aldehyde dehydrogenase family protein [Cupriavidus sp. P-10]